MNTTEDKTTRPLAVTLAVVFLVINFGHGLVRDVLYTQFYDAHSFSVFALALLLEGVTVWCIACGRNWARWLLLALFVLGAMSARSEWLRRFQDHSALEIVVLIIRLLANLIVFFALFHRSSNQWFLRGQQKRRERQRRRAEVEAQVRQEYQERLSGTVDYWQRVDIEAEIAQLVKQRLKLVEGANAI